MADNFRYAQLQPYSLAGSGAIMGDTTILLKSMTDIDGTVVTFANAFGTKGFATMQPGEGTSEEQISFSGITQNANGTATLTGVKSVTFLSPYTETSGLMKTHAGSTTLIISNTSGFYNELTSKDDDETINGIWTFTQPPVSTTNPTSSTQVANKAYVDGVAIAGAPDSSTTVKGIGKVSVAPVSPTNPIFVGDNDPRVPTQGENDALVGTSGTPSSSNKYVTNADTATAATANAVARRLAGGNITVITESQGNNTTNAASTAYVDAGLLANGSVPFQAIPIIPNGGSANIALMQSNQDGSVAAIALYDQASGVNNVLLKRLARDAKTGQYYITHAVTYTSASAVLDSVSMMFAGSFMYLSLRVNGTFTIRRFNVADFTNETGMTISGATGILQFDGNGFSDGTNLYMYKGTASTAQKYTISGTTATNAADIAFTSANYNQAFCDGINVYIAQTSSSAVAVQKYVVAGGALLSTTNLFIFVTAYPNSSSVVFPMIQSSGKMGLSYSHSVCTPTAVTGYVMELQTITQP